MLDRLSPPAWTLLILLAVIVVAPLLFPSAYYYRIGTLIFINGLAVTGLVVLIGYAGQISLGHAGFAGIGAYSCAILPTHFGVPPVLSLIAGAAIAGGIAWIVGRPILRLRGHYLAVATLGFGMLIYMALGNESQWTGGPDGMTLQALGLKDLFHLAGFKPKTAVLWYWFTGAVLVAGALFALNLRNSATGRALRSLHDSEVAARVVGVDVARYKLAAFVISAVYASLAGSLLALFNRFITPDVSSFLYSIELVTMTVLGGASTVMGGILGAALLTALPQALTVFHDYEHIVLGLIMMIVMIFMREGLLPSLRGLLRRRVK
jgi:branched-chain amino acid transport system permease protein